MPKIQILNETQVQHFFNEIMPKYEDQLKTHFDNLKEEAKKIENDFLSHEKVIEYNKEQSNHIDKVVKLANIMKSLSDFGKNFTIKGISYNESYIVELSKRYINDPDSVINEHNKTTEERVKEIIIELSQKKLGADLYYEVRGKVASYLRTILCMTKVENAETIIKSVTEKINIQSFL